MRVPLAAALLASLAVLLPPAQAAEWQTVPFQVTPLGSEWAITVPATGPVTVEVHVQRGGAVQFDLDGPGACAGASAPSSPASKATIRFECGTVGRGNYVLSLSASGAATGYLTLIGAHTV